ncbi:MAG: hypothetical protein QM655_02360, partial [Nocardioidaceae bacterium]
MTIEYRTNDPDAPPKALKAMADSLERLEDERNHRDPGVRTLLEMLPEGVRSIADLPDAQVGALREKMLNKATNIATTA